MAIPVKVEVLSDCTYYSHLHCSTSITGLKEEAMLCPGMSDDFHRSDSIRANSTDITSLVGNNLYLGALSLLGKDISLTTPNGVS